jgi:asparagine synthase (glutamine-hydrolysing)
MSIFAGILSRRTGIELPPQVVNALRTSISRAPEDAATRREFSDEGVFIVNVDIGAYGEPGHFAQDGVFGFVAGLPLLQENEQDPRQSRDKELQSIANELVNGCAGALRACRGQYCAVVYDQQKRVLHLVVDKLGVRPIYYWISPDYIVFSTALRVIEELKFCAKSLDQQGLAERACFGYSLADRTAYQNVKMLRSAEVATFHLDTVSRQCYWRWDDLLPANDEYPNFTARIYGTFRDAVRLRLRGDKTTAAFLSGGLDSRSIVAMLRSLDVNLLSISFGPSGSQDEAFAALAAKRLGTEHTQLKLTPLMEGDAHSKATLLPWVQSEAYQAAGLEHPKLLWSGDGGSVGMGHVYVNEEIVSLTRAGKIADAARVLLAYNRWGVQTRLFKPTLASSLQQLLQSGIEEEINAVNSPDRGRMAHLFLMLNDQRRHLAGHFENIDVGRVDFHVPFFDAEVLTAVLREPIDPFLRHKFYLEWLKLFPAAALEAPWQAYPGHAPCPLPIPEALSYQWARERSAQEDQEKRRRAISDVANLLADRKFAAMHVRRAYLHAMRLLMHMGMSGREYLLHAPMVFHKHWRKAQGG